MLDLQKKIIELWKKKRIIFPHEKHRFTKKNA